MKLWKINIVFGTTYFNVVGSFSHFEHKRGVDYSYGQLVGVNSRVNPNY